MEITDLIKANSRDLSLEFQWLRRIVDTHLKLHFGQEADFAGISEIQPPDVGNSDSNWAALVRKFKPTFEERLALVLALAPCMEPRLLDVFFTRNPISNRPFSEFGGISDGSAGGFIPTEETLLFLLSDGQLDRRFAAQQLFLPSHFFARENLLTLVREDRLNLPMTAVLSVPAALLASLTHGQPLKPGIGTDTAAGRVSGGAGGGGQAQNPG